MSAGYHSRRASCGANRGLPPNKALQLPGDCAFQLASGSFWHGPRALRANRPARRQLSAHYVRWHGALPIRFALPCALPAALAILPCIAAGEESPFCGGGSGSSERLAQAELSISELPSEVRERHAEAKRLSEAGYASFSFQNWRAAEILHNGLAAVKQNQGAHREAERHHRAALEIARAYCETSDDLIIMLQANIASSLNRQALHEEARQVLLSALSGFAIGETRMPDALRARRGTQLRYHLGHALIFLEEYQAARAVLLEALAITASSQAIPPTHVADLLQLAGRAAAGDGNPEAAAHYYDQAIALYETYDPHTNLHEATVRLRGELP